MFAWEKPVGPPTWECFACSSTKNISNVEPHVVALEESDEITPSKAQELEELEEQRLYDEILKEADPETWAEMQEFKRQANAYQAEHESRVKIEEQRNIFPVVRGVDFVKRPKIPVEAYVPKFVYAGGVNWFCAAAKAGKSTLTWAMLRKMLRGEPFLGQPTRGQQILYVSEQGEISFRRQLEERCPKGWFMDIVNHPNFYMLLPENHVYREPGNGKVVAAGSWEKRLNSIWTPAVESIKPDILVLDTFSSYAALPQNGENDASLISSRAFDLKSLCSINPTMAILILHHTTKTKRANGPYLTLTDIRGSGGIAASGDHIVLMNRLGNPKLRKRFMTLEGRMCDADRFVIDWTEAGEYESVEAEKEESITSMIEPGPSIQDQIATAVEKRPEFRNWQNYLIKSWPTLWGSVSVRHASF
jgi:AAA domain